MPGPTILAFDTSGKHCAAALMIRGEVAARRLEHMDRGQAERLIPLLEQMLQGAELSWSDLDAIGVGVGPGNFTGIRISVSAARGLALALKIPAIGVTGFEIAAADRFGFDGVPDYVDLAGPRGVVYRQAFAKDAPVGSPVVIQMEENGEAVPEALDWNEGVLDRLLVLAARKLASGSSFERPAPLYVRPADAAPPKDAGPVILP